MGDLVSVTNHGSSAAALAQQKQKQGEGYLAEVRAQREREGQQRAPPTQRPADLLQSHFQLSKQPVARPSFSQKRELARLTEVAFRRLTPHELDPGWRELLALLGPAFFAGLDTPCSDATLLEHPLFWRALGFSGAEPNYDFLQYEQPEDGAGRVRGDQELARGERVHTNRPRELPLSPLRSRFRGGLLTQQCMLYFVRECPIAPEIIRSRRRGDSAADALHYNWAFVCMEISRFLALELQLLLTRVEQPPNFPIQPDVFVTMPFDVDWQDKNNSITYPIGSIWAHVSQRECFPRVHLLAAVVYDHVYTQRDARIGDTYSVLAETRRFIRDCLVNSAGLAEMESMVSAVIIQPYLQRQTERLCSAAARGTVKTAIDRGLAEELEAAARRRALGEEQAEVRRLWRREGRAMVAEDHSVHK